MTTAHALSPRLETRHQARRDRRVARTARLALEHDLSTYTSPSDLQEWDAILSRYDDEKTVEIREILNRQRAA